MTIMQWLGPARRQAREVRATFPDVRNSPTVWRNLLPARVRIARGGSWSLAHGGGLRFDGLTVPGNRVLRLDDRSTVTSQDPYADGKPRPGDQPYPGQAQPGQPYFGGQPYPPQPGWPPTGPVAPPRPVQLAFRLWIADLVVGAIGALLLLLSVEALLDASARSVGGDLSDIPDSVIADTRAGITVTVVSALVFLALYAFFAFRMRAGRNWARITLTVLAGLGLVYQLIRFGDTASLLSDGPYGILIFLLSVTQIVLVIAAIVMMYRPGAGAYFARR